MLIHNIPCFYAFVETSTQNWSISQIGIESRHRSQCGPLEHWTTGNYFDKIPEILFISILSFLSMVAPQSRTDLQGAMLKYAKKYSVKLR